LFEIDDLELQEGIDYVTQNGIVIHHPTIKEIRKFGEKRYTHAVSIFSSTAYDYMIELEESGTNFLEVSNYDLFLLLYNSEESMEVCKIFLQDYTFELMVNTDNEEIVLYDNVKNIIIDRLIYEEISAFIKRLNVIPLNPPHDLENLKKKPFLKNLLLDEKKFDRKIAMKKKKIQQSELSNNIGFIVWNNSVGYNYDNIWDLKIYQFYEGLIRLQKTNNYNHTMFGVYSGNVDSSKLNFEEISWYSRIKIN